MGQEDFTEVCTQAYVSQLERGLKSPTLGMIEALAEEMGIHPLALLLATYEKKYPNMPLDQQITTALGSLKIGSFPLSDMTS